MSYYNDNRFKICTHEYIYQCLTLYYNNYMYTLLLLMLLNSKTDQCLCSVFILDHVGYPLYAEKLQRLQQVNVHRHVQYDYLLL